MKTFGVLQRLNDSITPSIDLTMAIEHFPALLLFSLLVSVVFGVLSRNTMRDRLLYGVKVFGWFVGIALVLGWIMYPLPW